MKRGDLVKHTEYSRVGVILGEKKKNVKKLNKVFDICWADGTMEPDVWDYCLELVKDEDQDR